jgi:hypothetical protein
MMGAGLKKCSPSTRSGRVVAPAIAATDRAPVFDRGLVNVMEHHLVPVLQGKLGDAGAHRPRPHHADDHALHRHMLPQRAGVQVPGGQIRG